MSGFNLPPGVSVNDLPGNQETWQDAFDSWLRAPEQEETAVLARMHWDDEEAYEDLGFQALVETLFMWANELGFQAGLEAAAIEKAYNEIEKAYDEYEAKMEEEPEEFSHGANKP